MELHEFNLSFALKSFSKIAQLGVRKDGGHIYNGIMAQSSYDGYTITLSNADVELSIFFHNKHKITFKNKLALDDFLAKIENIAKQKVEK